MRRPRPIEPAPGAPRLRRRRAGERVELWTETVGRLPPVYGERWRTFGPASYRAFEPGRSKLAAALTRGWSGPLPGPGERWLYLGAATGTTASHVADLVGPAGRVYAVERSLRPFARLLHLAERWPNLLPILGDARVPERYGDLLPIVDGIYCDVAQPEQLAIVRRHVAMFLEGRGGAVLLALKTSSMGRDVPAPARARAAEEELDDLLRLEPSARLDPFYRSHFMLGGRRDDGEPRPPGRNGARGAARPPRWRAPRHPNPDRARPFSRDRR